MPKKAFIIKDFSGGLNNKKSPGDLAPNELTDCKNLDPSNPGELVLAPNFGTYVSTIADFAASDPPPSGGLFVFSNDFDISSGHNANTGDFVVKYAGSNAIDVQETSDKAITTDVTGSNNVSATPQFYTAEGDLFAGGDHSTAPCDLKWHYQKKFNGPDRTVADWISTTQTRIAPVNTTDMNISETYSMTDEDFDSDGSGNEITGLGANELNWIIHYEGDDTGLWNNDKDGTTEYIEWGGSWLYKNNAESTITALATGATMTGKRDMVNSSIRILAWTSAGPSATTLGSGALPDTMYGAKLYAKVSGTSTWYLAAEANFEKGVKGDGESEWTAWASDSTGWGKGTGTAGHQAETGSIVAPPSIIAFETLNGFDTSEIADQTVYWKHGVVANGRAYVGNVLINGRTYGDRILKSPVFQYDVFSEDNYIDIAANDGDSIIALAAYGDILLVFKERSVALINISKELEYLEDTKEGAGVSTPGAIAKTPYGLAWANGNAVYLFDGKEVRDLSGDKIHDRFDFPGGRTLVWNDIGAKPSKMVCGYSHNKKQLVVLFQSDVSDGSLEGQALVWSFATGTWHYVDNMVDTSVDCSNMVNLSDGTLIVAGGTVNNDIHYYKHPSNGCSFQTGNLSFDDTESRKNLLSVKIRYKNGGSNLTASIHTNDDSDDIGETESTFGTKLDNTSGTLHTIEWDTSGVADLQGQYWYRFQLATTSGSVNTDFYIDEVVLTYRDLGVR